MSDVIKLLPDSLANQIAAGEVVQRPASVIKELLENAIDAKSQNITVIVKEAGKTLIQIIDDGIGMSETDARMCFERHATSKIRKTEDLFNIRTMGFRGEALASIAAVAQLEMRTKREGQSLGTKIIIEGSHVKTQENDACPKGTNILVKNLFYNVPARRNFLKSNPVELRHIMEEFHRVAVSNPNVTFRFYQNDLEVYHLKSSKLGLRIVNLFGKSYQQQLVPCQEEIDEIKISGYIGKPEFAKKTRGEQYFFVNNRFIKSSYLNHAVINAYHGLIPDNTFPFFVLFIELDPQHVDINVHPTKTEVKFDDERTIYSILKSSIKKALGAHNLTPSMDYTVDTNFMESIKKSDFQNEKFENYNFRKEVSSREESNIKNWEDLYISAFESERFERQAEQDLPENSEELVFESAANNIEENTDEFVEKKEANSVFQIRLSYIVTPVKSGMMIIDQQRAHERILFEKFSKMHANNKAQIQQHLFPETIELNAADFILLADIQDEIKNMGFAFEEFGKNTISLSGTPVLAGSISGKELLLGVLNDYKRNQIDSSNDKTKRIIKSMAKYATIKKGNILSREEMISLINQLFACVNPNYTPDGDKTYFLLDENGLDKMFN